MRQSIRTNGGIKTQKKMMVFILFAPPEYPTINAAAAAAAEYLSSRINLPVIYRSIYPKEYVHELDDDDDGDEMSALGDGDNESVAGIIPMGLEGGWISSTYER